MIELEQYAQDITGIRKSILAAGEALHIDHIREQIDKNLGVSGLFMPWLFVALFTNTFDIMILFYTLYYVVSFVAICYLYSKKASAFEIEAQSKLKRK